MDPISRILWEYFNCVLGAFTNTENLHGKIIYTTKCGMLTKTLHCLALSDVYIYTGMQDHPVRHTKTPVTFHRTPVPDPT